MPQFHFDATAADRAAEFFRRFLTHTKGALAGQPFALEAWQEAIVRQLFGWKREDGTRKYRTLYLEVPRKNGKTTLAAGIALYLLFADGEKGAEIYSAAADRQQAALTFEIARGMVEASAALSSRCEVYRNSIVVAETGSSYKVLSADAPSKHGFNSHGIIFDELHAQSNRELYDVLHTSTGARRQPLEVLITTAGIHAPESIGYQLHDYAAKVRDGAVEDDAFLPVIYAADPEADYRDPEQWAKANPNLGVSVSETYLSAEAKRAQEQPSYENTFRRLHLNQWTQQGTRWLSLDDWDACQQQLPDLTGRECFAGLDLSTTTDLSALVLLFPPQNPEEPTYLLPFFWIPEARLADTRDRVPYDRWAAQGLVTATPGDVVDYDRIRADINALGQRYAITELAADPWNSTQLLVQLGEVDGFNVVQVRQGFASLSAPTKELERLIRSKAIAHDGNAVLRWMVSNVAIKSDPAGNIKPAKDASTGRIDGVSAAVTALSRAMLHTETRSVYEERGILWI